MTMIDQRELEELRRHADIPPARFDMALKINAMDDGMRLIRLLHLLELQDALRDEIARLKGRKTK